MRTKAEFTVTDALDDGGLEAFVNLERLREVARLGKQLLVKSRKRKAKARKPRNTTQVMAELKSLRLDNPSPEAELYQVNKMLDRDFIQVEERRSLKKRRNCLLEKINPGVPCITILTIPK